MTRAVHVPYTVEQDEDGIWCAHAQLRPGVGANPGLPGVTTSCVIPMGAGPQCLYIKAAM